MKTLFYKVFTKNSEGGNTAAVVFGEDIKSSDAPVVAHEIGAYMTVLVLSSDGARARFRFFARKGEMDFCGHGILAGAYAYASRTGKSEFAVETNARTVTLHVAPDALVQFETQGKVSVREVPAGEKGVLHILGINPERINRQAPFCVASIGSPKLLVPAADLPTLMNLNPNLIALERWSAENRVGGAYVYCFDTIDRESLAHARAFNPLYNEDEDAATGVAAGALVAAIARGRGSPASYMIEQGDALGKPCRIWASVKTDCVSVGGYVTPV